MGMCSATPTQFHRTPAKKRPARGASEGDRFGSPELLIGDGASDDALESSASVHPEELSTVFAPECASQASLRQGCVRMNWHAGSEVGIANCAMLTDPRAAVLYSLITISFIRTVVIGPIETV